LLSLLAVAAYALHARLVIVLPLGAGLILVAGIRRTKTLSSAIVGMGIIAAGYLAVGQLNLFLQVTNWGAESPTVGIVQHLAHRVADAPLAMILRSLGHAWYQLASSLLVAGVGAIVVAG